MRIARALLRPTQSRRRLPAGQHLQRPLCHQKEINLVQPSLQILKISLHRWFQVAQADERCLLPTLATTPR